VKRLVLLSLILSLAFLGAGVVEIGPGARIFQYDQSSNVNFSQARNFSSIGVRSLLTDFGSSNFTVEPENSASAELDFYDSQAGRQDYVSNFTGYASSKQEVTFNISDLPSDDFYEAFFSGNDTRIFIGYALGDSFDFNLSLSNADISVFNYGEKGVAIDNITFNDSSPVEGETLGIEEEIFNEGVVEDEAVNKTLTISTYNGSSWEQKEFRTEDLAVPVESTETEQSFTGKFEGSFTNTTQYRTGGGQLGLGYQNGTSSDDLVGYWRMDKAVSGSGGTVVDYSGENNDGTTSGGVSTGIDGILGSGAMNFDSQDDYVSVGPVIGSGKVQSRFAWVKPVGGSGGAYPRILHQGNNLELAWKDGSQEWAVYNGNNWLEFGDAPEGKWQLVGFVWDGSDLIGYDGTNSTTLASSGGSASSSDIYVGANPSGSGDKLNGSIDEVRIYNRSLSKSEVKDLYFHGAPFRGNYTTKKIDNGELTHWYQVNLDANIPSETNLEAEFRALDSSGSVVGTDSFTVEDGDHYYNVSVPDSEDAELYLNGSSENLTKSWEVDSLKVISGGPYVDPWEVEPGPWRFNVSLDPEDEVKETNESNNRFTETLDVDSYQIFHGDTNSSLVIGNGSRDIYKWDPQQNQGYIFFSDVDSSFGFSDLEAVNGSDLVEVDEKLNLTGHNDSSQELWDRDGDGTIDRTNSWDVGGRTLEVPVTNSTEDSPFDTGILYDSGDGSPFDGTQDVVFMTRIRAEKTGKYGTYDYEARIPFSLESQEPGSDLVDLDLQLE
jgi:hypothetical protein